jgi:hypothetical protein
MVFQDHAPEGVSGGAVRTGLVFWIVWRMPVPTRSAGLSTVYGLVRRLLSLLAHHAGCRLGFGEIGSESQNPNNSAVRLDHLAIST